MNAPAKSIWPWAISIALIWFVSITVTYSAFHDLFIEIPGISVPRINITPGTPGITYPYTQISFYLDTPTVSGLVILVSGMLCALLGVRALWLLHHTRTKDKKGFFMLVILMCVQWIALGMNALDVLSSAGKFG
jgi:hypothetical protein